MNQSDITATVNEVIRTPEELTRVYPAAFSRSDLDAVVALYEPGAVLVPQPGQFASGAAEIRQALRGFLSLKPNLKVEKPEAVQAGEIALICYEWNLVGNGPDGSQIKLGGHAADILRRQPNGNWLIVVDHPFARIDT